MRIEIRTGQIFNYEDPQDENRDNVYTFQFSLLYRGQTLSTTLNVSITDIADNVEVNSVVLEGEAVNQLFGLEVFAIPDVSGDGKPEIGTHVVSGVDPRAPTSSEANSTAAFRQASLI
ncbi:MAG: hypothetical protein EOP84_09535 [Verrucomicrobiaceae bacterium]|nr:MAG: hypothetical protein EOP84_09535 [Verrucomicrobiaceae bacterium]